MNESINESETDVEKEGGHGAGSYQSEFFFVSEQGNKDLLAVAGKATEIGMASCDECGERGSGATDVAHLATRGTAAH
jgi:hypothetical protein